MSAMNGAGEGSETEEQRAARQEEQACAAHEDELLVSAVQEK